MTSESSTRLGQLSKVLGNISTPKITLASIKFSRNSHRGDHGPEDGNVSSSIKLSRNSEHKGDNGPEDGQWLSVRSPSPEAQPQTINVVLFGETGVGKSSVINLIARRQIAKVSSDVDGCTMQYQCYPISFDNMDFAIFDTVGLEEPQMGVNGYLKAIEKAYELISRLSAAGGIHLLLFCMRGGRITATTQSNYRLFCECLCNTKVPIALVFTGLEREDRLEDWWMRNKTHIEHYGIKSDGHACITAVQDDTPEEKHKYEESQEMIRKLLKTCARKGEAFSLESHTWFAGFMKKMKGFVPARKSPKKKDVLKVLTNRCKLDADTAKRIAEMMMDKGDTENKDAQPSEVGKEPSTENKVPQPEEGEEGCSTENEVPQLEEDGEDCSTENEVPRPEEGGKDRSTKNKVPQLEEGGSRKDGPTKNATMNASPSEQDTKAVSGVVMNKGKKVMQDSGPPRERGNVKAVPDVVAKGGKDDTVKKNVAEGAPLQEVSDVKAPSGVVPGKEITKKNVAEGAPLQEVSDVKAPSGVVLGKEITKKNVADSGSLLQDPNSVKAPPVVPYGGKDITKNVADGPVEESRNVKAPPGKKTTKNAADVNLPQEPSNIKAAPGVVPSGGKDVAKKNVAPGGVPSPQPSNFKAVPTGKNAGKSRERGNDGHSATVKFERRNTKIVGDSGSIVSSQP